MRIVLILTVFVSLAYAAVLWQGNIATEGKVSFYPSSRDYVVLKFNGLENYGHIGEPSLPYIHRRVTLDGQYNIQSVSVSPRWSAEQTISNDAKIIPILKPNTISSGKPPEVIPDNRIYNNDEYFPKSFQIRWSAGSDGENTIIDMHIPAALYNPVQAKYRRLLDADISVSGIQKPNAKRSALLFSEENLVLVSEELQNAGERLMVLHGEWGIPSAMVTVEEILSSYSPAEYPPVWGFPESDPIHFTIDIDPQIAMRIVSFLRDDSAHPNLRSITILGNEWQIPPSYYFRDSTDLAWGGDEFDAFLPTDFFYSSPDYDWVPDFSVGRIPIYDNETGFSIVEKLRRWHSAATPELFSRVLLAGGNPFDYFFDGEHTVTAICRDGYIANANVKKLYASRANFTRSVFDTEFRQPYGIVYMLGHGSGMSIAFDDETSWATWDVESLAFRNFGPAFMMGSCLNGMYDAGIVGYYFTSEFPEVLIANSGGPIAFWGCSRTSYGTPSYHFDGAEFIVDEPNFMSRYNAYFFLALAADHPGNFGDWDNAIKNWYVTLADINYWAEQRTFLEYNFFGDPALPLPEFLGAGIPDAAGFNCSDYDFLNADGYAEYLTNGDTIKWTSLESGTAYSIPMVIPKPINADLETTVFDAAGDNFLLYPAGGGRVYCVTMDSPYNVEARYYFYAASGKICADGYREDWDYLSIPEVAVDPGDYDEAWLDLRRLYVTDDPEYLYIAFTNGSVWDWDWLWTLRTFTVAIDYRSGGYTGILGEDTDPAGTFVCFDASDAPDIIAAVRWDIEDFEFYAFRWDSGHWSSIFGSWSGPFAAGYNAPWDASYGFGEIAIPRYYLPGIDTVKLVVYSALSDGDESPAQDCIPSDSATYHELTVGAEYSNRLSSFLKYGFTTPSKVAEQVSKVPDRVTMHVSPNPFNSICRISISRPMDNAEAKIFDFSGKLIVRIPIPPGKTEILWNAYSAASGIYFINIAGKDCSIVQKAVLVR